MVQTGQAAEDGSTLGRMSSRQVHILQAGQGDPLSGLQGSGALPQHLA